MAKKCHNCGEPLKNRDLSCSKCGLLLVNTPLAHEQEARIAAETAAALGKQRGFLWGVGWRTFVMVIALLGFGLGWGVWSAVEFTRNLVLEQFKEEKIHSLVANVASNQAGALMLTQIDPEVRRFRQDVSNTIDPIRKRGEALDEQIRGMSDEFAEITARNREGEQRLSALNAALSNANVQLNEIKSRADVAFDQVHKQLHLQALVSEALADSRPALTQLMSLTGNPSEEAYIAAQTINKISGDLESRVFCEDSFSFKTPTTIDSDTASLEQYRQEYNRLNVQGNEMARVALLRHLARHQDKLPKTDRFRLLAEILNKDQSLIVTATLCHLLDNESHLNQTINNYSLSLTWLTNQIESTPPAPPASDSK